MAPVRGAAVRVGAEGMQQLLLSNSWGLEYGQETGFDLVFNDGLEAA
jgi:hypothetical protein